MISTSKEYILDTTGNSNYTPLVSDAWNEVVTAFEYAKEINEYHY